MHNVARGNLKASLATWLDEARPKSPFVGLLLLLLLLSVPPLPLLPLLGVLLLLLSSSPPLLLQEMLLLLRRSVAVVQCLCLSSQVVASPIGDTWVCVYMQPAI